MKTYLSILFFLISPALRAQNSRFSGSIGAPGTPEDCRFQLVFIKDHVRVDSIFSQGNSFSHSLPAAWYDIEIQTAGYLKRTIRAVELRPAHSHLNFTLQNLTPLDQPGSIAENKGRAMADSAAAHMKTKRQSGIRNPSGFAGLSCGVSSGPTGIGSRADGYAVYTDGVRMHRRGRVSPVSELSRGPAPSAGLLTAGHWRDLDHWHEWTRQIQLPETESVQKDWGFAPKHLLRMGLRAAGGEALCFYPVELLDSSGNLLWKCKSDQEGIVFFWPFLSEKPGNMYASVRIGGRVYSDLQYYMNNSRSLQTDIPSGPASALEIAFVCDATGSMGDEIAYLQAELPDILQKIRDSLSCMQLYSAAVFYRDHGDDYLTRHIAFSNNSDETIRFIRQGKADGGGDYPEAIDQGLETAISQLGWSGENNPKILFLIQDAPAHQKPENLLRLRSAILRAAGNGIRIIPVSASGTNLSAEFLMKNLAILSNGEYVYLSDDSRIGNTHLKPSGGSSAITSLNELMMQLIFKYSGRQPCSEIRKADGTDSLKTDQKIQDSSSLQTEYLAAAQWSMKFYPNPAAGMLHIGIQDGPASVRITDLNGRTVYQSEQAFEGERVLDIRDWSPGIYIVHALNKEESLAGRLVCLH